MGFCDIWNNQGQGKYNQDITKTESNYIIVLLYTFLKKITTNTPLQGTWTDIVIGNHALHPQPSGKLVIC